MKFDEVVAKAIALEAAKSDAKQTMMNTASTSNVHRVSQQNRTKYSEAKQNNRINFRKLGIEGLCLRCGKNNHFAKDCRINRNKLKCEACKKVGHLQKVCIETLSRESAEKVHEVDEEDYSIFNVVNICQHNDRSK